MKRVALPVALIALTMSMSACSPLNTMTMGRQAKVDEALKAWDDLGPEGQKELCKEDPDSGPC